MSVSPFSRYRNLSILEVEHATRGTTRSLPVRRSPVSAPPIDSNRHRFSGYEAVDLLALKYFGREELYWHLLDANHGRLPDSFEPGEIIIIPPINLATRIKISGR
jgi:hypothetical protein